MTKKLTLICSLLAVCLGLLMALPAKAASLQLVPNWVPSGVPTNLSMYVYVPDNVAPNPPILVLLHYWGGTASSVFNQAAGGGIVAAADQYGFIMVVPQRASDCWDYGSAQALTHDGGGETHGIAQMVRYAITNYHANANRVYVTGDSCGGMMTEALLGVYPDIFKAGAAYAGVPIGGAWTPVTHTAQEWGNLARAAYPGYTGSRPRVQLWHGTADGLVNYSNHVEAIMQWGNVLGLSTNPTTTTTVIIPGITNQWTHQVWKDTNGATLLDAWSDIGGDHGPSDALFKARYVIPFLGLDKVGPVDPGAGNQRGRPHINAAHSTFVADNGERLRGPFTSSEWSDPAGYDEIEKLKALGCNALHIYGECFDSRYPTNGSTAPGYAASRLDRIVAATRDAGLYLIITIGNGANNGNHNYQYAVDFWKFYAPRYANETHVIYEIHNEPVAWGPSYVTATSPAGAMNMEIDCYNIIRTNAPNTPVLLFSYAVFNYEASSTLTDIRAFNSAVFGNTSAVWTNEAVAFHGYGYGWSATSQAASALINAGYPCFMTEFGGSFWGTDGGSLDAEMTSELERLGVSWLCFFQVYELNNYPDMFSDRVNDSGLSWTPDFGSWPPARGPYGNGGQPRTIPASYVNSVLTGAATRIQAEDFDNGGEGVAYHFTNTVNSTLYRTNVTVPIETTTDTGGGYNVTGTAAGEWLEYNIWIQVPGYYNLTLRYATPNTDCAVQVTGNGYDESGTWTLPGTGGATTWATATQRVLLEPGRQVMRLGILNGGFKLNWLELRPATSGFIADGTYKFLNGANGLALTALTSTNLIVASNYVGLAYQQWNLQHIGGGQYKITAVGNGWCWYLDHNDNGSWLELSSGWDTGDRKCFIIGPTSGGYYAVLPLSSGWAVETSAGNQNAVDQDVCFGGANQQWAIVSPSAPAFPTGLSAVAVSSTQIALTWNAVTNATSYNVKRATNSGGAYTPIATGVTGTNYTDIMVAGTTYYYVVSAVVGGVESLNSMEATLALPFPWVTQDVGSVGVDGSASYSNGVFSVRGSGSDIWGTSDGFRFAYVPVTGNCTIVARVVSLQYIDGWSKAGVMIRDSLADNAANAFMAVTPGNGVAWQTRSSTGDNTGNAATPDLTAPYWVKLVRSGNTFTGYRSVDGTNWTQQGSATFTMASTAYVGLALTSHNNSTLCLATFDNVSLPGWPPPVAPTGLIATVASTSQINLVWNAFDNATSYNVKRSATSGGPYTLIATGVMATNYLDTGVSVSSGYYYVVSAMVGGSETPDSAEAALSFAKLTGAIIGTAGSYNNLGDTITKVFDNNLNTFFDAPTANGAWAGLDFGIGVSNIITQINYCPRASYESRMVGGIFQGANQASFSGAVTLATVTTSPASGVFTSVNITNATAFRYVRYLSPNNGWGNVAEVEFYGYPLSASATAPAVPGGLVAAAVSSSQINLSWNASAGATNYKVKRSTTNGGPYLVIASGSTATNYNDTGLAAATTYYYVVSALNAGSESTNSTQTSATTALPPPAAPAGLTAATVSASQINLSWPASSGATGYNVKRSTTNGGSYAVVASGVAATNYNDTSLAGGTIYYYVVSAVNAGGESPNSDQATATTSSGTLGSLVHRYSFSETNGASIADSVGGPIWNGTLPNGGTFASDQLTLASATSQYAQLPAGIVGGLSNFTIVTWVRLNSTANWTRLFDFGGNTTTNMFLTPQNGLDGRVRFAITTNGGGSEQQINCNSTMITGVWYQVAVTLNGNKGVLYLNGVPVGTNNAMTLRPSSLGSTANNYLGRSQYSDPYFNGLIDEFRIYNIGLSAAEIAATAALGASQQLSTNNPAMNITSSGANLTMSWPLASAGYTLQSRTNLMLGSWANVASPAPQIVGSQWQVTLPPPAAASQVFYRLTK